MAKNIFGSYMKISYISNLIYRRIIMQMIMVIVGFIFVTHTFIAEEVKPINHKKDHSCCKKDTTNNKSNKQDIPKFQ